MKKLILELSDYDMFTIACFQMGRFFSDDATSEERIANLDNISVLRKNMDERHNSEFAKTSKMFEGKEDLMKLQGQVVYDRFVNEVKDLLNKDSND